MSEEAVRRGTERGWDEWFALLDEWGATRHTHSEIATWLVEEYEIDGWWAQSVTVGYEQARGMRTVGQRCDGSFTATASKTVATPVEWLYAAFAEEELRERWLPDAPIEIRTTRPNKSLRANWGDDGTRLELTFLTKGETKSQVSLEHQRLADSAAVESVKVFWRERMTELKQFMES